MKKILIVDDSNEIRAIVKATLDTDSYKIYEASNGMKAVESAQKNRPDLIIMDLFMPGSIDGIEAISQIKQTVEAQNCQIIILTGSEQDLKKVGLEAGANDFINKPFSPLDLLSKIEHCLGTD